MKHMTYIGFQLIFTSFWDASSPRCCYIQFYTKILEVNLFVFANRLFQTN